MKQPEFLSEDPWKFQIETGTKSFISTSRQRNAVVVVP